jgi:hypothetical protein
MVGTPVRKHFPGHGTFRGNVIGRKRSVALVGNEMDLYTVQYEDGDVEDLVADELRSIVEVKGVTLQSGMITLTNYCIASSSLCEHIR